MDADNGSHSTSAADTAAQPIDTSAAQGPQGHEKNDDDGEIDPKKYAKAEKRKRWFWWLYRFLSTVLVITAIAVGTLYAQWYQQDVGSKYYPSNCNEYGWTQTASNNGTVQGWFGSIKKTICTLSEQQEEFDSPIPVRLVVRNCRVDILGRKDWPGLHVQYSKGRGPDGSIVELPDWDSTPGYENQTLEFVFEGPVAAESEEDDAGSTMPGIGHGCRVLISVGDSTVSDLTVEVKDSGVDGEAELSMTHVIMSGALDINGAAMNFRGREIVAADVNIQLEKGTVDFSSGVGGNGIAIIDHESGGININLGDGDIVVAPVATSQIDLEWYVAFAAIAVPPLWDESPSTVGA